MSGRLLVLCACLLSVPAWAGWNVETVQVSPKHPRVRLAPRPTPTATLVIRFPVGSVDDGLAPGLTRLAQRVLLHANSTEDTRRFHQDLYAAGATLETITQVRECGFELTASKEAFPDLAARLLRLVLAPKPLVKELAVARTMAMNDQVDDASNAHLIGFLAGKIMVMESGEDGGDFNAPVYGDPEMLRQITFPDVKKHLLAKFGPMNATVLATGGFEKEPLLAALAPLSGGKRTKALPRADLQGRLPLTYDLPYNREMHLRVFVMKLVDDTSVAAAHVLAGVLNEHIMWKLRRMGITYSTGTLPVVQEWMDGMVILIPISGGQDLQTDKIIQDAVKEIQEGKLPDGFYLRERAATLASLAAAERDSVSLASLLATDNGRREWINQTVVDRIGTLDQATFQATVGPWLEEKSTISFIFGRRNQVQGGVK